jgi:hypothetical protein
LLALSLRHSPGHFRTFQKRALFAGIQAGNDFIETRHKTGLAAVLGAYFVHDTLPIGGEPGPLVASPRLLEILEGRIIVLALFRIDDAHALGAPKPCRYRWAGLLQFLRHRLGGVVAHAFEGAILALADEFREPPYWLSTDLIALR